MVITWDHIKDMILAATLQNLPHHLLMEGTLEYYTLDVLV
jgi:hypothetical protein